MRSTHSNPTHTDTSSLGSSRLSRVCVPPCLLMLFLLSTLSTTAVAQGILTITPSPTASVAAGTGAVGYTGDGGAATAATLASPSAVAYDAAGDIFLADAANHVVREIAKSGTISTIAGTGIEGYGGDNGPATSAQLDTPTGVAVDGNGNIYIADSHNHRIRKVAAGTITTVAGIGTPGFSGDGGAAIAAQLFNPTGVAVDSNGNLYIADTNNQVVRKVTGTTIGTLAGTGEETFAGDGATATSAVLDSPTGVAVDSVGNVYIADRHNHRIRMVSPAGTITTLAGGGSSGFSGTFAGDGTAAAAAALAKPSGVSVDASGNVYIADTGNQRIREVAGGTTGGTIATVLGSGQQGFGGDSAAPSSANLNMPHSVAVDTAGNLAVADKLNQLVRSDALPMIAFVSAAVGNVSAAQTVTLSNTGSAAITVGAITFVGAFETVAGGSCSAPPIALAAGASCTQNLAFLPVTSGAVTGSVVFGGAGDVPQTLLLSGTSTKAATTTTVVSSVATAFINQTLVFTATVKPQGLGTPTGTVTFFANGAAIGSPVTLPVSGTAALSTAFAAAGTYAITAVYSGDSNFTTSTSTVLSQPVGDFSFNIQSSGSSSVSVEPGQSAVFQFVATPLNGPFNFPITLSATGLPPGATATFAPTTVTPGSSPASFTMSVQTAATARLHRQELFSGGGAITVALIFLPFGRRLRRGAHKLRGLTLAIFLLLGLGATLGVTGCGSGSGFFGQQSQSYTINVYGTATNQSGATVQHVTTVTLTVQ
jgi:Bacterial Ig-like domain (group 3)/NHL repeat